ncbi:CBS domain-containing protein [Calidifontibacter sp. DB0510]|uniref:CBS domain-containing protein n=1 Tax=Metallococcus carri TaxID=1656884 RepID=A0A967E8S4_9MICO|nr:CBS domain-containing protein [Metallococcus carri]NHN55547.1 CBS domain-containing protein [Metallococcus carri]NOP38269.1 CBS domain-containing protein [Calidifontibacter sp. DB2511S]
MKISDVVRTKGSDVVTIRSDASVGELVALLAQHRIGAVVVVDEQDSGAIAGIVSERDVVRGLGEDARALLDRPVGQLMTTTVHTCAPSDEIHTLAALMTERRVRHVPVVEDGRLQAIVSIGDVVKFRLQELQTERDHLQDYISG